MLKVDFWKITAGAYIEISTVNGDFSWSEDAIGIACPWTEQQQCDKDTGKQPNDCDAPVQFPIGDHQLVMQRTIDTEEFVDVQQQQTETGGDHSAQRDVVHCVAEPIGRGYA